ncbi:hypothetical protein ACF3NX_12705 [Acetobacter orientalis]|uniref:hypothetical protein n=1 Tax=Acetobacter orientalis TaxID=146474 RepID=UPI00386CDBFB
MEAEFADQWESLARDEMAAASAVLSSRLWKQAHQHAGVAVECALKRYIMKKEGLNRWPERRDRRELYTHNLEDLLEIAALEDEFNDDVSSENPSEHARAWLIIKDWDINMRYHVPSAFPQAVAESAVEAIVGMGLVEWLLK